MLGVLGVVAYAVHAAIHLVRGEPWDLLWTCHLGCLLTGIGLLAGSAAWNGIGLLWLSIGVPLWVLDLATGGELLPTSLLTHLGGLVCGLAGVRSLGLPRGTWLRALAALFALGALSHLVTPRRANVNLAHAVWSGWETVFPSYGVYAVAVLSGSAAAFLLTELGIRRALR